MTGTMASPSRPSVQIHRVAGADDDQDREDHVEPAKIDHEFLEQREHQRSGERHAPQFHKRDAGDKRNAGFDREPRHSGESFVGLLGDFQIVVIKADHAEAERHPHHDPDVRIARIGPQQSRDDHAGKDHQAAHGRRAGLGEDVGLRAIRADRLAFALQRAQAADDGRAEQKDEQQRGDNGAAGAERDIAKDVEDGDLVRQIDQPIKHRINLVRTPSATCRYATRQSPTYSGARIAVAAP